jgi:hypothetical protein
MDDELLVTLGALVLEFAFFFWCYIKAKQPINPLRPRLFPYALAMIFLGLAIFVTTAHSISVATGHRIEGRTKMKGQSY